MLSSWNNRGTVGAKPLCAAAGSRQELQWRGSILLPLALDRNLAIVQIAHWRVTLQQPGSARMSVNNGRTSEDPGGAGRLAALKEAAKAICWDCRHRRKGPKLRPEFGGWVHVTQVLGVECVSPCGSGPIWNLVRRLVERSS